MLNEIEVLRRIKHDNVVTLYEIYETKQHICLLCSYMEGGQLFDRIKSKGLYRESDARPVMSKFL